MLPLKDDLPTQTFPYVTIGLIIANILVFMHEISLGPRAEMVFLTFGAIPYELMHGIEISERPFPITASVLTSMFIHGGFFHVGGNMLYLWIFGNNIEDVMGHFRFILFYLICGIIAVYSHAFLDAASKVPMVGASGAVSGVLGAYILLFPRAKVLTLVPLGFFLQIIKIPAVIVLGFWIVAQFFNGFLGVQSGVAWFAHIGGFIAGMVLIFFFRKPQPGWRRPLR
ncbi:MAG: rhomboid family intramembrane serine protease [Nitrospiria bacterium]